MGAYKSEREKKRVTERERQRGRERSVLIWNSLTNSVSKGVKFMESMVWRAKRRSGNHSSWHFHLLRQHSFCGKCQIHYQLPLFSLFTLWFTQLRLVHLLSPKHIVWFVLSFTIVARWGFAYRLRQIWCKQWNHFHSRTLDYYILERVLTLFNSFWPILKFLIDFDIDRTFSIQH